MVSSCFGDQELAKSKVLLTFENQAKSKKIRENQSKTWYEMNFVDSNASQAEKEKGDIVKENRIKKS